MARRKTFGSFGGKRKSYGKAFRVNTKGGIPTSVSLGGGGMRVNVGKKGRARMSVKNPITGRSTSVSGGASTRRRSTGSRSKGAGSPTYIAPQQMTAQGKKRGGCLTWFLIVAIVGIVVLAVL